MDELHHECGVAALYYLPGHGERSPVWSGDPDQLSRLMPRMLLDLQNRGQLAAGMATYNPDREQIVDTYKEVGTVIEAFRINHPHKYASIMEEYAGRGAIGHTRYATCGAAKRSYAQPFERRHGCKWKWFAFAFNGQLTNFADLREQLLTNHDYHLTRDNDTEVIMHYIAHELRGDDRPDLVEMFRHLATKFDGAYNLTFLNAMGDMVVLRDPVGIRPLVYAQDGPVFGAASESVALQNLGFRNIKSLEPGQMVLIQNGELSVHQYAPAPRKAHCFFEWIYFANVSSSFDDRSVYLSRARLGQELAKQEKALGRVPLDPNETVVVPVPDTGKAAADAMAFALGIPSVEGLIRNRYIGRTFIEGANRADKVRLKFTPLREVLSGKKVLLVEDSIVRSTTLKSLLHHLRDQGGAKEIHVRVACPPIIAPCFYGIDMSTVKELFAPKFMAGKVPTVAEQDAMAKELGADSLFYLPVDAVSRCIDLPADQLCRACVTGDYPTANGEQLYQLALRNHATGTGDGRTYDRPPEPLVCSVTDAGAAVR
ncbi:amidophosphoribosyltransferase : Amidophosphoribosyltransferase OS=Pirellula staleyi (strain ATCC 27377 / DSM 6068 / ICPB 4128) GN=Psta_2159 PE=3 SV=1: GATase_6: Pribosyltran [Gemmataceae bacterium]|jgi:amidophosphoribosyltransferase|nr:amidophosphoribosyltransferase : Amidophosphoribosyltransferase OS=Pirellula staleyi (strain ATCC 27377 / DSM 6068 / ICPB 4128) GN=Psta_2159 PE=3 SV=1: GATase_6: Pribosyltran [Gemmataceae bacterium]VTU00194.1 amidophosphoribosyltransferase : Amidophosphoribosyltransferase OS=Pirellula staleyi (strain ATCC 27377 / DSM 6068 / ICPB 4128) GN=Psta_2159 PE=3 SV=1: GATase_6: Pribosyltran [Gemmataceae bacterium]